MNVEEIMTPVPYRLKHDATVKDAAKLMDRHLIGCVVVVDEQDALAGIVTDRDVCLAASAERSSLDDVRITLYMSTKVKTCRPSDDVESAAALMRQYRVRRLPVTDSEGSVAGLLSVDDIAHARDVLGNDLVAETLAAVARRRTMTD